MFVKHYAWLCMLKFCSVAFAVTCTGYIAAEAMPPQKCNFVLVLLAMGDTTTATIVTVCLYFLQHISDGSEDC